MKSLQGDDKKLAETLQEAKLTLSMKAVRLEALWKLLSRAGGVATVSANDLPAASGATVVSLSLKDIQLRHVVELLTLPYGLDAKIEDGKVVIFARKR